MQIPDAAVGSILAAVIGGFVVFISTVLSKEQKTSEFRQTWIDELRKDIADYISGTTEVVALSSQKGAESKQEQMKFIEESFELIQKLQTLEHRIILRLNPSEHRKLVKAVQELRPALIQSFKNRTAALDERRLVGRVTDEAQYVLKSEWDRVKKGEPIFRFVKGSALFCCIAGLVAIAVHYWK